MSKKNYYVVVRGRKPGIYQEWSGSGGAAEQVQGFPGALYKGFATRAEAKTWQKAAEASNWAPPPGPAARRRATDPEALLAEGKVVIYTDGGAIRNPGRGGYGAVLLYGDRRKELSGGFRHTTSNRMELRACIEALKALRVPSDVVLFSDSSYVVNAMTKGWLRRWQRNGWRLITGEPVKNVDLWRELAAACDRHKVEFHWVRGHAGTPENERADELATGAARGADLGVDGVFEAGGEEGVE